MQIAVIDGMGGGIGRAICQKIKTELPGAEIIALGTNSSATSAMIKAGAGAGATGENAIIYNCANVDVILGSIGIIVENSMMGELSHRIASAIAGSPARKILIPTSKCHVEIAGAHDKPTAQYIDDMIALLKQGCAK